MYKSLVNLYKTAHSCILECVAKCSTLKGAVSPPTPSNHYNTKECAVLYSSTRVMYSTTRLQTTTTPQTTNINDIHCILACCTCAYVVECAIMSLVATSYFLAVHTSIKLDPRSSEWNQIWNVASWLCALDRNGEFFPIT